MSLVLRNIKGEELTWDELDGNFNYLESLSGGEGNRIITQTGFSLLDQDLTINAGWVWKISGIEYTNENAVVLNFPYAAASNERLDLVVLTASNSFDRIAGPESETNPVAPSVPNNTLLLTIVSITDGSINEPSEPILGTQFKEKSENRTYNDPFLSGENAVAQLRPEGFTYFSFGSESLISLAGFSSDLLTGNANAKTPYLGQDFMIVNSSASVFVLKHGVVAEIALALPNGDDLEVPVGGKILFKYRNGFMEMIFKSWSDTVDISGKLDKVTTAGVERAYIVNPDGTQEMKPLSEIGADTFTLTFNTGNKTWVLDTWYQQFSSSGFNISGTATYGTGTVPTSSIQNNASALAIPDGYILSEVFVLIPNAGNVANIDYRKEFYITRGQISQDSNAQTNLEVVAHENFDYRPTGGTRRFFKKLTIANQTAETNRVLQISIREKLVNNAVDNVGINFTFKKA
jgi:hypothetical protein